MPFACASGHSVASHCVNAASAAAERRDKTSQRTARAAHKGLRKESLTQSRDSGCAKPSRTMTAIAWLTRPYRAPLDFGRPGTDTSGRARYSVAPDRCLHIGDGLVLIRRGEAAAAALRGES